MMTRHLGKIGLALVLACLPFAARAQVAMNLASPQQTILCHGAATSIFGANGIPNEGAWSAATIDTLYNPAKVGLTCARIGIASADAGTGSKFEDNNPGFQNQMVDCLRILKLNPNVKIIAAPWSPNVACKSGGSLLSGSFVGGGTCNTSWSTYIGQAVDDAQNAGCKIYMVSAQNEPDFDPGGTHEGATMTAAVSTSFLKSLGPVLAARSPAPLLGCCETSQWINAYTATGTGYIDNCTGDSTCLAAVGVWTTHSYTPVGSATAVQSTLSGRPLLMTEASDLNSVNDAMTGTGGGLASALWHHNALVTGNASGVVAWWGVTHNTNNDGLIDNDGTTVTKRAYVLGQFARFVLPGMVRFGITGSPPTNVSVSTYKDPTSNNVAVVAINNQASTQALTVTLDSTSKCQAFTAWVTDPSNNIVAQTPVNIINHVISATLTASSVTTFTCNGT